MAKKKKEPPSGPSNAYLISFGDTMTALLAFFIVINSLAQEQTGANLHSGTGSFVNAMSSMGLPGKFQAEGSINVAQKTQPGRCMQSVEKIRKTRRVGKAPTTKTMTCVSSIEKRNNFRGS